MGNNLASMNTCSCYNVQEFNTHSDENDPDRVQQIIERAMKDVEWIVNQVDQIYAFILLIMIKINACLIALQFTHQMTVTHMQALNFAKFYSELFVCAINVCKP